MIFSKYLFVFKGKMNEESNREAEIKEVSTILTQNKDSNKLKKTVNIKTSFCLDF